MRRKKTAAIPKEKKKREKTTRTPRNKAVRIVYLVLRILVVLVMIRQFFNQDYNNVFLCLLTLLLFMIPSFVERRIRIDVPDTMEIIILLFIFSAEILGEIQNFYLTFPYWDTILHTMNGFLMAAIGFSLIDILNQSERFSMKLSPLFIALVTFTFSMTTGVIWEFFEFGMDQIFHTDMQKDTIIQSISSVLLNPEGKNIVDTLPIENVVVNGQLWNYGGYIDIGLIDTMEDLFVNFIGALFFSVFGFFYTKRRSQGKLFSRLILKRMEEGCAPEPNQQPENKAETEIVSGEEKEAAKRK